jgi:hypothetical protein
MGVSGREKGCKIENEMLIRGCKIHGLMLVMLF